MGKTEDRIEGATGFAWRTFPRPVYRPGFEGAHSAPHVVPLYNGAAEPTPGQQALCVVSSDRWAEDGLGQGLACGLCLHRVHKYKLDVPALPPGE